MDQIRIIIVEDGKQTAAGINKLVQFEKDMLVVGMAETGEEAIRLAGELDPHVILMDTGLPDMWGIEAARTIIGEQICVQAVLLALEPDTEMMRDAMKAGIRDVVRKPPTAEALYKAIREAHEHYLELLPKTGQLVEDTEMAPPPILGTMMAIYSGKGELAAQPLQLI